MGRANTEGNVKAAAITREEAIDGFGAFEDRFEAVRPRLLAICRTVIGADDAEDVVQETYLRARDRIAQLRNPLAFEAWLVRIALNEARSLARHRSRRRVSLRDPDLSPAAPDRDVALLELVDQLPIRQRMAVVLFYGYGYDTREVARMLSISVINARTVLFRARRRLRRDWEAVDGRA
jgi:RNA polymerase sigma factor (sigma-70 family)